MFDVMTITRKGLELLAQATAANKLVIVGCDATADFTDAATAATTSARPANPLASTTEVTILSASNTSVFTRAAFIAGTSTGGGQAKSFFLYGHSANDTAHDYVICVASTNISVHIPLPGELINTYGLEFETVYSGAGDTVTVTGTANYCTLAEFNVLKERTVTTHKEGDPDEGDDQYIRGAKVFLNGVTVEHSSDNRWANYDHNGLSFHHQDDDGVSNAIKSTVAYDYGTAIFTFIAGYRNDPTQSTRLLLTYGDGENTFGGIYFLINSEDEAIASIGYNDDLSDYEFFTTNIGADKLRLANSLSFSNGVEFVVNQNNLNIGSDAKPVGTMIAASVKAPQGALVSSVEFDTGKFNYTDTKFLTNYSNDDLYIKSRYNTNNVSVERLLFYNSGLPNQNTTDTIIDGKVVLTKVSGSTHTIDLSDYTKGVVVDASPSYANSELNVHIGAIVACSLPDTFIGTSRLMHTGEEITIQANTIFSANISTTGWASSNNTPLTAGKYVLLHNVQFSNISESMICPVFLKRIADAT